jgi:hypothetical protein
MVVATVISPGGPKVAMPVHADVMRCPLVEGCEVGRARGESRFGKLRLLNQGKEETGPVSG